LKKFFLRARKFDGDGNGSIGSSRLPVLDINANIKIIRITGFMLISIGVLLAASSGGWDITNHLLNKPETFFSPPHAGLYAGVAIVVFASILVLHNSRRNYTMANAKYQSTIIEKSISGYTKHRLSLPLKLIITGVVMLLVAGPFDFAWHSAFGLDGLLSPSHITLTMGLVLCSIGALVGILSVNNSNLLSQNKNKIKSATTLISPILQTRQTCINEKYKSPILIVIGVIPVWITLSGLTHMLSLPFSDTEYFKFNPDPTLGAIIATLALPFLVSFILISSFQLTRKFGVLSITGGVFMTVNLITSILPNQHLLPTIPFYLLNLISFLAIDMLLSKLSGSNHKTIIYWVSGAILGLTFFMVYYPLDTHTYNEILVNPQPVWPSLTIPIYFDVMNKIYPLVALPSITMGILGAIFAHRFM
jgi:hypothetical protein